jgi:hypothetical protein
MKTNFGSYSGTISLRERDIEDSHVEFGMPINDKHYINVV